MERDDSHEIKEITQEKFLLEDMNYSLSQMDKKHRELFSSLNHETRTALVTLKAYTDMLLAGKFGKLTKIQKEKIELMKDTVDTLTDTILEMANSKSI